MPKVALQQYSPAPQSLSPQGFGVFSQNSCVQNCPTGAQRLQLALQQYSPAPQVAVPQAADWQSASEHATPCGAQTPPQLSQQTVPAMQRIVAQGEDVVSSAQSPWQLRSRIGSQPLAGDTQT
jgi:hypothetical protein